MFSNHAVLNKELVFVNDLSRNFGDSDQWHYEALSFIKKNMIPQMNVA